MAANSYYIDVKKLWLKDRKKTSFLVQRKKPVRLHTTIIRCTWVTLPRHNIMEWDGKLSAENRAVQSGRKHWLWCAGRTQAGITRGNWNVTTNQKHFKRRVQFKLTLTATFRTNSFHSDVMFGWMAKPVGGRRRTRSLGKHRIIQTKYSLVLPNRREKRLKVQRSRWANLFLTLLNKQGEL